MINTQGTAIIRERGQLTIPDSIRKVVNWATPLSAVDISVTASDEILIKPHKSQKEVDWDKLWERIKRVRAFKGKGGGNLSKFIAEDRYRH